MTEEQGMSRIRISFLIPLIPVLMHAGAAGATVIEPSPVRTLTLDQPPLDMAISSDGQLTFVLSGRDRVLVYSPDGTLIDTIALASSADGIDISPDGSMLFLRSSERKAIEIVALDFSVDLRIDRSPVKGPADAPVTIAVFSDFQ